MADYPGSMVVSRVQHIMSRGGFSRGLKRAT